MSRTPLDRAIRPSAGPKPVPRKPRVLHLLASLDLGGVETWLMQMLRNRDRFSVDHEILLTRAQAGHYEEEARRLGIAIHRLPMDRGKLAWLRSFRRFLAEEGPFEAVHSHVYLFSAAALAEAKRAGVPARIAHCHTARSRGADRRSFRHKLRRMVAARWIDRVATRRIGISEAAIAEISGTRWRLDPANSVLIYGFDFSRFHGAAKRARLLRKSLGIAEGVPVVGHVGRFDPVKNHHFLLEAFHQLLASLPEAELVLAGDGPTRPEIEAAAKSLGLENRVHFAGTTDDVAAYMRMFDLFVLPSLSEGLGIVAVEAQAAGTGAIVSDSVPAEVQIVGGAIQFLALSAGSSAWGAAMAEFLRQNPGHRDQWLAMVEQSRFAIERCIVELDQIYRSHMAPAG